MASNDKGGRSQLPVEIWQQVSDHLSSKNWARISRTCRATHMVQPAAIDLNIRSESAMAWVQTHWGQAKNMKLTWLIRDVPWVVAHNAASLTSLQSLQLQLKDDRSPTSAMLLTWLLAQAPALRLLSIQQPRAFVVPPIRNLRHLVVTSQEFPAIMVAAIRQLRMLQTLWLGVLRPELEPECAEFDLAGLTHLSDVAVDNLMMPRLTLPKHCRLHLTGFTETVFLETWYGLMRHGQLKSISLKDTGGDVIDDMPGFLAESKCTSLHWWYLLELGERESPLLFDPVSFKRLTHLKLSAVHIHIVLPQAVPLKVLHVSASYLSVTCVSAQSLGFGLAELKVLYKSLKGCDIFEVVGVMSRRGKTVSKIEVSQDWEPWEEHDGFLVSSSSGGWQCSCGACLACLQLVTLS